MPTPAEIEAQLTGPGCPFEIVEEPVFGDRMPVFKARAANLREVLSGSAKLGSAEYLVCEERRISFAEHERIVASVARGLSEKYGVGKGDRVAILAANCPEWIVSFWAALSLGAIAVGLNGWWVRDEIEYGVRDCDPRVLIGDRNRLARVADLDLGVPVVEIESGFGELWNFDRAAPLSDVPIGEDDPATILYTSGTTGRPKGAVNTHRNIVALTRVQVLHGVRGMLLAASRGERAPATPTGLCALVTTPLFHVSGLYSGVVTFLSNGVKTVWTMGRFDPQKVLELIEQEKVTTWGPMGTMVQRLLDHPDVERYDLSSLVQVGSGGAPVGRVLQERMRKAFPNTRASMGVGYGLTGRQPLGRRDGARRCARSGRALHDPLSLGHHGARLQCGGDCRAHAGRPARQLGHAVRSEYRLALRRLRGIYD